jgi:phenylacetate-coenzyme A ligase PaaK-like adenylate-forming protein
MQTVEHLDREQLSVMHGKRLSQLLVALYGKNPFYTRKLDQAGIQPSALELPGDLTRLR